MAIRISPEISRRSLLVGAARGSLAVAATLALPAYSRAAARPLVTHGLQSGDIGADRGVLWARTDRPAKAVFEWSTTESFADVRRLPALDALPETDHAVKILAEGLPSGQDIFWRVAFHDLADVNAVSETAVARFRTAPTEKRDVSFVWSGDTAGQGWGIDEARGGMTIYRTMLKHRPDFFVHSGDTVYADGPIKAEVDLPDGTKWKNVVTEEKAKVAETLAEYRGQYKYNLMDANVRAFNEAVPMLAQWDDHEVTNNWSPSKTLDDRYHDKSVFSLAANAARAFHEMMPTATTAAEPQRVYRKVAYGPLLDVFLIDMRTYRGPNGDNLEAEEGPNTLFLGADQRAWLKRELKASKATWKVIAADMPLALVVWDDFKNKKGFEAVSNNDPGKPLGRELEFADLLKFIKDEKVTNTVWLTADVHYTAAHYYDPNKAVFQDFEPFWEFVSGPLHAGTFGPNDLDPTFGPELKFVKAPTAEEGQNLSPAAGLQFFGHVAISAATEVMTVTLRDAADAALWSIDLEPRRG
ncbi:alkaline phosphatase D family protein [Oharaeibacter diazotrophicus]|uniref:Alkaline phosphatase D n=1 Tax=Oharaeibacter diazotrophicus TaxID=1920512 RepID=A0A4R6RCR9_9HYPH|nr:alkaline phosphatase D family protein [Oharaeibacter diazotrophicus]TDP83960.1 alkaline phosphatase D [Oharaeibacter diazotrophicus]BBE72999.1 alkaline phosphatase D precursor [Pleomorphomonas sp. SM30]GLS74787.1 alkaline phosphatase [Oharaeibacter diazotrophicus]